MFLDIFIVGTLVATVIEYVCSFVQEKIFKTKSWDYSDFKYNLNGRVNLVYSIGFGMISMIIIKYIKQFSLYINRLTEYYLFFNFTLFVFILFML